MRKIILFLFSISLFAQGPFESITTPPHQTSMFNSTKNELNIKASENEKIKCRYVCDKKIYKEQVISDAITFYLNSKDYSFNSYSSSK
ncbi:MAG: hypothetical protein L3I99_01190 [Sulfurimonas sp.]|nr:hypothetical protein [Sulfurimonas sp.]